VFEGRKIKVIAKAVEGACRMALPSYEEEVREWILKVNAGLVSEEELPLQYNQIRKSYFQETYEVIRSGFEVNSPSLLPRISFAMMHPSVAGIPDEMGVEYVLENGPSAGLVFAWMYFAMTGKPIDSPKAAFERSRLSHYQTDLMNSVLDKFE
jgi:hypothetical protein